MKTLLRWLGIGVSVLIGLALIGAATVYSRSSRMINQRYYPGVEYLRMPSDSAAIAHGRHFVQAITKCTHCHGEDLGGTMFINSPAFGRIPAPNITRGSGGRAATYSDIDWVRSIRHGVKRDGRAAVIMPAESFVYLSDRDLADVIAYVKSVPPVDRSWPEPVFGPVARTLMAAGQLPVFAATHIPHDRRSIRPAPPPDTTTAYGDYLSLIGGCRACHNPAMSGGKIEGGDPGSPPAANLTRGGFASLTEADFVRVLREGKRPGTGQAIDNNFMPWKESGRMTDTEIHAIWLYLQSLPSKEIGQQ